MEIRRAKSKDLNKINDLLYQIHRLHSNGRPDVFRAGNKKYTDEEVLSIIADDNTPVFVAVDDFDNTVGYAFCVIEEVLGSKSLMDMKTFYIDDLCVDSSLRGKGIGTILYKYVVDYAKKIGCYRVTLNVWELNESAKAFYQKLGLKPLKTYMEEII